MVKKGDTTSKTKADKKQQETPADNRTPSSDWPAVDMGFLAPTTAPAPAFPLSELPATFGALISGLADARQVPLDYVAGAVIGACSGAVGNRARLLNYDGSCEPGILFVGLVGPSSSGKSSALNIAQLPLQQIDRDLETAHAALSWGSAHDAVAKLDQRVKDAVARRLYLEGQLAVVGPIEASKPAPPPAILLSKFSGPGLLDDLRYGLDGRMLLSHELVGALDFKNSYQGVGTRALVLEGFDGNQYTTTTKTYGRVHIPALHVTMLGIVQPKLISTLLGKTGDGLAARMMWFYPDVVKGRRLATGAGPVQAFMELLTRLVAITPNGQPGAYPALVPLAEEARAPLEEATVEWDRLRAFSDEHLSEALGRATQYARRLAFLLSVCEHAARGKEGLPDKVTKTDIKMAIAFVHRYVLPMAERIFGVAQTPGETDALRLYKYLCRLGKPVVSNRDDILRGRGSPVQAPERAKLAVEELRQRGFLKPAPQDPALGRPPIEWEVNLVPHG